MNTGLLIIIGISLSMDTFSLALSLGTFNIRRKYLLFFPLTVGIFHFFMPLLGNLLGKTIEKYLTLDADLMLGIIFMFISIEMILDLFSKNEKEYKLSIFNIIIYSFSVSIDSFSLGIGLDRITTSVTVAGIIFCFISSLFTYLGLLLGKYSYKKLGKVSKIIGIIIIVFMSILHFLK